MAVMMKTSLILMVHRELVHKALSPKEIQVKKTRIINRPVELIALFSETIH